jgi:hypothetical protein
MLLESWWHNLRHYPGTCLEELKKTRKLFRCPGRELNRVRLEYGTWVLPTQTQATIAPLADFIPDVLLLWSIQASGSITHARCKRDITFWALMFPIKYTDRKSLLLFWAVRVLSSLYVCPSWECIICLLLFLIERLIRTQDEYQTRNPPLKRLPTKGHREYLSVILC